MHVVLLAWSFSQRPQWLHVFSRKPLPSLRLGIGREQVQFLSLFAALECSFCKLTQPRPRAVWRIGDPLNNYSLWMLASSLFLREATVHVLVEIRWIKWIRRLWHVWPVEVVKGCNTCKRLTGRIPCGIKLPLCKVLPLSIQEICKCLNRPTYSCLVVHLLGAEEQLSEIHFRGTYLCQ